MSLETQKIPTHIGIIMDGNGRWARNRGFHRSIGHAKGSSIVKNIVDCARLSGIKVLSLYCFSTENWSRPSDEINVLMDLLRDYLIQERGDLNRGNIKVNFLGQINRLPETVFGIVNETVDMTQGNTGMILNFCVSYGGRTELLDSFKKIASDIISGKVTIDDLSEELIADNLYTAGMPDPDLIIRTSGEFRTSNFLVWQAAYSEFYVTDTLWPDFNSDEFAKALEWFSKRKRRFGHTDEVSSLARLRQARIFDSRAKDLSEAKELVT